MTLPTKDMRAWRCFYQSIVVALCVWAGVLMGTQTHAAEHPVPLPQSASLISPDDKSLAAVIKTSLSPAIMRADTDRGSFKPLYLTPIPQSLAHLGQLFHTLERIPSRERYVFHRCCVAQAGGTRAPPKLLSFPCLLSL